MSSFIKIAVDAMGGDNSPEKIIKGITHHHSRNKDIFIVMNQHDRKQLEIAHLKLDDMRQDLVDLKNDMEKAHQKTDESLSFIKENLFNPHEGLWAETKENTRFRENSQKWRGIIGVGFIGLVIEKVWSIFT